MKTVSGKVTSTIPISLSAAAKSLSKFASSNHEASHAVSLYLQRAADSFNHLVKVHQILSPNNVKNEHSADDVKVEEISESKRHHMKSREVGLEIENVVNNVDIPNGSLENKKSKHLGKSAKNDKAKKDKVKDQKLIKTEQRADIGEGETVKSKKNEVEFGKIDKVKDKKLIKTEKRVDIGEGEMEKSKKNELEFVKIDSSVKTELGFEEVKEDGVTSKDKKKRKKKNRGVSDSEQEVGKVEEDLVNKAEEEGKKRKNRDLDAGENAGSTEQSSKKKSKKRRIEGEK